MNRPATVAKRRGKVRLLVPCGDRLPSGVLAKLNNSPLDVMVVHPTLSGLVLRRSDVILLGDTGRLPELKRALKRMDAISTPVVTVGELDPMAQKAAEGLRHTSLSANGSKEALADAVLKAVVRYLKPLSTAKRAESSAAMPAVMDSAEKEPPESSTQHRAPNGESAAQPERGASVPKSETKPESATDVKPKAAANPRAPTVMTFGPLKPMANKVIAAPRPVALPPSPEHNLHPAAAPLPAPPPPPDAPKEIVLPAPAKLAPLPTFAVGTVALAEAAPVPSASDLSPPPPYESRGPRSIAPTHSIIPGTFSLDGSRWLLLDDDAARAHAAANALTNAGALVEVSRLAPSDERLAALRALGAVGALVPQTRLAELGPLLDSFQSDPALRGAHVIPIPWAELYQERNAQIDDEKLKLLLLPHWQGDAEATPAQHQLVATSRGIPDALGAPADAAPQPNASEFEDTELTVPFIARTELPLPQNRQTQRLPAWAIRGVSRSQAGLIWLQTNIANPVRAEARLWWKLWKPRLWHHRKPVIATACASVLTVCVVVALASTKEPTAKQQAAVEDNPVSYNQPKPLLPEPPKQQPAAEVQAKVAPPEPESDEPMARPSGCERWVGTEQALPQPKQAKSAWHMARKSLMVGHVEQAQQRLCLSMHLDVRGPGTLDLVRFFFAQDDQRSAMDWARWAVQQRPDDPEARQVLADAMHQSGNEAKARELLLESMNVTAADLGIIKSVAKKYANAGYQALSARDPAQADRLFRRATILDEENAKGQAGRAEIALLDRNTDEALRFAERAVELDPQSFEAQLVLGDAHAAKQNTEKARTAWLTAVALKPGSREARGRLGL